MAEPVTEPEPLEPGVDPGRDPGADRGVAPPSDDPEVDATRGSAPVFDIPDQREAPDYSWIGREVD
jgi:hypothetical protein